VLFELNHRCPRRICHGRGIPGPSCGQDQDRVPSKEENQRLWDEECKDGVAVSSSIQDREPFLLDEGGKNFIQKCNTVSRFVQRSFLV
jgi:hypothetical protein